MTEISDRYRRLSDAFATKVAAAPADAWDKPTPCSEWTVHELVRHVTSTPNMFLGFVGRSAGDIPSVDDDPLGAFNAAQAAVQADLDDPERAGTEFDGFFGRTTFEQAVDRFAATDLIIHGWDLAHATGQDEQMDPQDLEPRIAAIEAYGEAARQPGVFGPALEPPDGADAQTRLLALTGRQSWA